MSNNKLNCNAEIQTLKDQLQSQQRRMAVYRDTQELTMKNAEDMNKLIQKANQSVFCGPGSDCHKNQESERLKKIYENISSSNSEFYEKIREKIIIEFTKSYKFCPYC